MCGIVGFTLMRPVPTSIVFKVLEKLEVQQLPQEPRPVGGYGAGLAILRDDGSIVIEKIGKVGSASPAKQLAKMVNINEASVLIGHVRMPSPEFMTTAKFKETAQPYIVQRDPKLTIVSVHNGKVENYKKLRARLGKAHVFESEKVELIDSEVIPHIFEELLNEKQDNDAAMHALFCVLQGSNTIALLQVEEENSFLHVMHRGKTRGLTVWTNEKKELVFCTRKGPLLEEFSDMLREGKFREKISIAYHEDVGFKLSHPLALR